MLQTDAKFSRNPEARPAQIVEAALRVFYRTGVQQASVDEIVADAKVSKGLMYLYFKSKDALIEAVMKRLFSPDLKRAERLVNQHGTATEKLLGYASSFAADVKRYRRLLPLFFEYYALLGRSRKLREITACYYSEQEALFKALVQQGVARGEFAAQDAETAAFTLLALQEGLVMRWMMQPETTDWAAQAEQAMRVLLSGMAGRGKAPQVVPRTKQEE